MFEIVKASGSDARSFLQGQLTQDVERLRDTPCLFAAWCNPKGRVIALMRMIDVSGSGDEVALAVPSGLAPSIIERLLMFRFRARVDLAIAGDEWTAYAVSNDDDLAALAAQNLLPPHAGLAAVRANGLVTMDHGAPSRCIEVWGPVSAMSGPGLRQPLSDPAWRLSLVHAGVPTIDAVTAEKYTPHMLNLDRLGAVSFKKGCYTGQEVVARTEHLGKSKRRLMHFRMDAPAAETGDRLSHNGREVGVVVNVAGQHLLAVVPVELHREELSINGRSAFPVPLPYELPSAN